MQIRRVLIDLARKYARSPPPAAGEPFEAAFDPCALEIWSRFHEEVEAMPTRLRDVVELVWYHELPQRSGLRTRRRPEHDQASLARGAEPTR